MGQRNKILVGNWKVEIGWDSVLEGCFIQAQLISIYCSNKNSRYLGFGVKVASGAVLAQANMGHANDRHWEIHKFQDEIDADIMMGHKDLSFAIAPGGYKSQF